MPAACMCSALITVACGAAAACCAVPTVIFISTSSACSALHAWPGVGAGVQMAEAVPDAYLPEYDIEEEENADVRLGRYARDHLVLRDAEFYEDERDHFGDH